MKKLGTQKKSGNAMTQLTEPVRGEAERQAIARGPLGPPADCLWQAVQAQCWGHDSAGEPFIGSKNGQLTKKLGEPFHSTKFKRAQRLYVYASEELSIIKGVV